MRSTQRLFTEREDGYIRAHYHSTTARDIANNLERGIVQIRKRAAKLGLSRPLKRWTDEEDAVIRAGWGKRQLQSIAAELGRGFSETSSRAKKLECNPWRISSKRHSGRKIEGFRCGQPVYEHRAVVERSIGRKLRSDEIVHHVDANKDNNAIENLFVFTSRADHRRAHTSFESIIPILLERGIIKFNNIKGVYELCETNK